MCDWCKWDVVLYFGSTLLSIAREYLLSLLRVVSILIRNQDGRPESHFHPSNSGFLTIRYSSHTRLVQELLTSDFAPVVVCLIPPVGWGNFQHIITEGSLVSRDPPPEVSHTYLSIAHQRTDKPPHITVTAKQFQGQAP